jgi:hypothetical protein
MKLTRTLLILLALVALTVVASYRGLLGNGGAAGACGRCGDGACVRSCGETPISCPADCGVVEK